MASTELYHLHMNPTILFQLKHHPVFSPGISEIEEMYHDDSNSGPALSNQRGCHGRYFHCCLTMNIGILSLSTPHRKIFSKIDFLGMFYTSRKVKHQVNYREWSMDLIRLKVGGHLSCTYQASQQLWLLNKSTY